MIKLPTYEEAAASIKTLGRNQASPLEKFICAYEPDGVTSSTDFRADLTAALQSVLPEVNEDEEVLIVGRFKSAC